MYVCVCVWMVSTHIIEDLQIPRVGNRVTKFEEIQFSRQVQRI